MRLWSKIEVVSLPRTDCTFILEPLLSTYFSLLSSPLSGYIVELFYSSRTCLQCSYVRVQGKYNSLGIT